MEKNKIKAYKGFNKDIMGRAQLWLQSRGYTIRIDGEFTETKVHKLKF